MSPTAVASSHFGQQRNRQKKKKGPKCLSEKGQRKTVSDIESNWKRDKAVKEKEIEY